MVQPSRAAMNALRESGSSRAATGVPMVLCFRSAPPANPQRGGPLGIPRRGPGGSRQVDRERLGNRYRWHRDLTARRWSHTRKTEGVNPDDAAPGPDPLPGQGAPAGHDHRGRPAAAAERVPPAPAAYAAPAAPVTSPPALRHDPVAVTHPVTATVLSVATGNLTPVRATRGGPSPVMVGRDAELRQLARLFASSRPQVAMVAGEPGIGKSRLISELLASLPADTPALLGQAEPGSLGRPYELLLDALDGAAATDPQLLAALTDASRSAVERLHAGVALVAGLIGERPAVVVFEDLHWADSESAALFERIADLPGRLLLVGTYRPAEVTPRLPVAGLLARLERRHAVTNLWLDRLGPAETTALLANATGHPVPYRVAMALHPRTRGNPVFLEELVRDHAGGDLEKLDEQPLPWSLAEVLRRQLGELDPAARRIAEAAALLGQRVPFDLLATVTGEGEDQLIGVLRELVARGVLVESDDDEFSFRHALLREALTGQMPGRQRRRRPGAGPGARRTGPPRSTCSPGWPGTATGWPR